MTCRKFEGKHPAVPASVYIDESALVIGDVTLGEDVSIWPLVVVRGDIHEIRIGARSNVQDGSILHVTHASDYHPDGFPLLIGDEVIIGHRVVLHGCTIGDNCLIGMGAIIMDGAVVESEVIIGAGTLVPPGRRLESGALYVGSPAKARRPLTDKEKNYLRYSAANYVRLKNRYLSADSSA